MLPRLILLFVSVPLVELALLMVLAKETSPLLAIGLVILTGIVGATLAKRQGLRCWLDVQHKLHQGQLPTASLLDGLMILVAGALLLTPGMLTDLVGFALLTPPIRAWMRRRLAARWKANIVIQRGSFAAGPDDDVIDVSSHSPDDKDQDP